MSEQQQEPQPTRQDPHEKDGDQQQRAQAGSLVPPEAQAYLGRERIDDFDASAQIHRPSGKVTAWGRIKQAFSTGPARVLLFTGVAMSAFGIIGGYSMLSSGPQGTQPRSRVDIPKGPHGANVPGATVTPEESARHAELARRESEAAYKKNQSYQASFEPNVVPEEKHTPEEEALFDMDVDVEGINRERENRKQQEERKRAMQDQQAQRRMYTPSSNLEPLRQPRASSRDAAPEPTSAQDGPAVSSRTPSSTTGGQGNSLQAQQREERRRYEQELQKALAERERYVREIRQSTVRNISNLIEKSNGTPFGPPGEFSYVAYQNASSSRDAGLRESAADGTGQRTANSYRKPMIKAGQSMYATLDSEANTDESKQIFATIHGGKFDGAKVFGKIEMGNNNMSFVFNRLAPKDDRPTFSINAVALREEDAKQGMASDVDHHTLSRYTALAASSLLTGYGRAYARNTGETIITGNGTVVTNNRRASAREANASAAGEVGQAFSQEIRRGFDRPPTMMTPAATGFSLFFLEDVHEQQR